MENKRIKWIDIARGIGIILIVFGHAIHTGFLYQLIFSFHVPFFFILTGITYQKKKSMKQFYLDKIKRLIIPYFIFSIISIIIYIPICRITNCLYETNVTNNIYGMIYANSRNGLMKWNTPLWFLPSMFIVIIIFDFLERKIIKDNNKIRIIIAILLLLFGSIQPLLFDIILPMHLESAIFMIGFMMIGHSVKNSFFELKKGKSSILFIFALIIIGVLICDLNGLAELRTYNYGKYPFLFIFTSIIFSYIIIIVSKLICKNNILEYIGKNTIIILCLHKFPILFFQVVFSPTIYLLNNNCYFVVIISSLIITIICIILCLLFNYILLLFRKHRKC